MQQKIVVYYQVESTLLKYFCLTLDDLNRTTNQILKESKFNNVYLDNNYVMVYQFKTDLIKLDFTDQSEEKKKYLDNLWTYITFKKVKEIMIHITKTEQKAGDFILLEMSLDNILDPDTPKISPLMIKDYETQKNMILGLWEWKETSRGVMTLPLKFKLNTKYLLLANQKFKFNRIIKFTYLEQQKTEQQKTNKQNHTTVQINNAKNTSQRIKHKRKKINYTKSLYDHLHRQNKIKKKKFFTYLYLLTQMIIGH